MSTTSSSRREHGMRIITSGFGGTTYTNRYITVSKTRTGEPNPRWRQQVRDNVNASTPFTGSEGKMKAGDGGPTFVRWYPNYLASNRIRLTSSASGLPYDNWSIPTYGAPNFVISEAQALSRLHKAIREEMYQMSGPVFLGELRETARMLKRPLAGIQNLMSSYFSSLRTRRGGSRASMQRTLADTWLEYSFGWSPLISDVKSIAETLARLQYGKPPRSAVKGYGEYAQANPDTLTFADDNGAALPYQRHQMSGYTTKVIYRCGLKGVVNSPDVSSTNNLLALSGFQIQNFIPTAWELLPWSWLADYVTNLGDIIEAACTDTSSVTRTTRSTVGEYYLYDYYSVDQNRLKTLHGLNVISVSGYSLGFTEARNRRVTRSIASPTVPPLVFSLPGSPNQLANIAAVFAGGRRMQPYG